MISPTAMALAAMTVMLWIVWSDTIRSRRQHPILYAVRIALFIIVSGVMIVNIARNPYLFRGTPLAISLIAVLVGLGGAAYFVRKLIRRQ
ncbi:MAG TPA: hypothetical protein VN181_04985 [Thermoanaerobaculia bacterium]|nr:hypothetical protein [Thermoanaerobaculia bacterium]